MKIKARRFVSTKYHSVTLLIFIFLLTQDIAGQTSTSRTANITSDETMQGVTLQQTGVYQTKGVSKLNGQIWKSNKLFEINYALGFTPNFDGSFQAIQLGFSDPLYFEGLIYFRLCISPKKNFVVAIDSSTGKPIWTFQSEETLSSPSIAGD